MTTAAAPAATSMTGELSPAQLAAYVNQHAPLYGLDPKAVLAVASKEGLGGGIGDEGTSYGPFQLHIGGALPAQYTANGPNSQVTQAWAWSPAGINYALGRIAGVAKGQTGNQAITSIVTGFENPADPASEIAGAEANYGTVTGSSGGGGFVGGVESTASTIAGGAVNVLASPLNLLTGAPAAVAGDVAGAIEGPIVDFAKTDALKALAYVAFVVLGLALLLFGALDLFGYSPSRVVKSTVGGGAKLAAGDVIPF